MNPTSPIEAGKATHLHTILIVDDDPAMRTIVSFTLKAFDYHTLLAASGEEALQVARQHPDIRLILLDVVMSGLSGRALADQLQILLPAAALLFCSGHPREALTRYGVDVTAANFVQKPCQPQELQRKIEELLGHQ